MFHPHGQPVGRWDARGGALNLSREAWGVVIDALIEHEASARGRKTGNPASTSDARAEMCLGLIKTINGACR